MVIFLRKLFISMLVPFLWKKWRERSNTPSRSADQPVTDQRGQKGRRLANTGS